MINTDNNYLTEWDIFNLLSNSQKFREHESIKSIREYLAVMENEPEGYILISDVYHSIRRMLNDE